MIIWKKCKLGDFINIKHGFAFKGEFISSKDNGKVVVTPGNFAIGGGFQEDKCKFYTGNFSEEYILKQNDLIVTMTDLSKEGDTLGYSAKVPNSNKRIYLHNQRIGLIEFKNSNIDKGFLYWYMRTYKYQKTIIGSCTGSVIKHTSPNRICEVEINLPDLETQQKIAKILSAIDDKIELNNSINNNLEQQIKYLYNDYFCNCNEEIKITELIDVRDGTHDSPKSTEQGKHLITSKHLKKYGVDKSTANIISEFDYAKINERSIVCTNDILISMIGTVGIVSLIIENPVDFAVKNVGIFKTSNFIEYTYYIHCFLNSNNTQKYIKSHLAGTTQKYISLGELRNLIINKPDESQLNKFNLIVHPLYQQIILNVKENVRLIQLRDTLLPKLMSGEIDVSNVDISTKNLLYRKDI